MKKIKIRVDFDILLSEQDEIDLLDDHDVKTEFEFEHLFKNEIMETLREEGYTVNKVFVKVIDE